MSKDKIEINLDWFKDFKRKLLKIIIIVISWLFLLIILAIITNGSANAFLWFLLISVMAMIFRKSIIFFFKYLKNLKNYTFKFKHYRKICLECKKNLDFSRGLLYNYCQKCSKKLNEENAIRKRNEEEMNRIETILDEGIKNLDILREQGRIDNYAKKVFPDHFDEVIGSLYNAIFSTIIASLESSFKLSFEMQKITKKDLDDFNDFIKSWISKAKNDNILLTKDDYIEFKKEAKATKIGNLKNLYSIINRIEDKFNINKFIDKIDAYVKKIDEEDIEEKIGRIKKLSRTRKIREEAERRLYGSYNNKKRISLTNEEKEIIFDKFDNKCTICSSEEGLHIHHKDQNPQNNQLDNLLVLCGVCHKKVHMRVR